MATQVWPRESQAQATLSTWLAPRAGLTMAPREFVAGNPCGQNTMRVQFDLNWSVETKTSQRALDPLLFALLDGIQQGGHLSFAAKQAAVSYRHAWGLIRTWEGVFGHPLIATQQGRGARLTAFGAAVLELDHDIKRRLAPDLDNAALDASAQLQQLLAARHTLARIAASHSEGVAKLREAIANAGYRVQLDFLGSENALEKYRQGEADIVGFHLPLGELGRVVAARLIGFLAPRRDEIYLLETRTLGLMSRSTQSCSSLQTLATGDFLFVNRQAGAATRMMFDALLVAADLKPQHIDGYHTEEHTHTAVAAVVASGGADVGFGSRSAAIATDLHFEPLVHERFYVAISRQADSSLRRAVQKYCASLMFPEELDMKADEYSPTVAALKRIHRAGFWKNTSKTV